MPDFGMPTLIETKTLEDCALLCNWLGLGFIELNMNLPQYQIGAMHANDFLNTAEKYGLYYTIHLDENLNPCDFNPLIAQAYRQTAYQAIAFAKQISCPVLNMHLSRGVYFTLPESKVYLFREYYGRYLQSMAEFRDECEEQIGDAGLHICVENSDGYTDFQVEALDLLLKSPVFGLTLDIGHNFSTGGEDEAVILERAEKLFHMHMHDAAGGRNHLPLGTGELDIPRYLKLAADKNCRTVLETKTIAGLRQSAEYLKGI